MGFVFRRRLKLFGGLGLNISKSGISTSLRTSLGSINKNGASIRTGITGLQYKHSWKAVNKKRSVTPKVNRHDSVAYESEQTSEAPFLDSESNRTERSNNRGQSETFFSYSDYLLIDDYASLISSFSEKIKRENGLISAIEKKGSSLKNIIISDVAKILYISRSFYIDFESLEMLAVIFLHLKISEPGLSRDYDSVKRILLTEDGSLSQYSKEHASFFNTQVAGDLTLPALLKALNPEYFHEYTGAIYRFASLIIKIDLEITKREEQALQTIWATLHNSNLDPNDYFLPQV